MKRSTLKYFYRGTAPHILTSMFSSVFVTRGLSNLWYGRRKKLTSLSIGQVWKPDQDDSKKN